ncbi:MAG TPA: proprotein convertase P-domain-containing protein [Rubricoccaceae bacterium]
MTLRYALAAVLVLGAAGATAQPLSSTRSGAGAVDAVSTLRLPAVSNAALLQRDAGLAGEVRPLRFAEPFSYSVDAHTAGTWEQLGDARVWRLVVESAGAYSLNFGFSQFRLPEGASLWVYAPGRAPEYRPFTSADNEAHGELWTPIVPGSRAVLELDLTGVKAGDAADFDLVLGQVAHAYRPAFLTAEEKAAFASDYARMSGSCNVDVICPQGDPYRDIIRSSGGYTRSGTDICSGSAVNTTRADGEPNFLTANHCGNSTGNAASVVVYWNYQNSTCRAPGSPASGGAGDGPRTQFNSGTVFRGSSAASDWNVLTFDDPILPSAQVYLSGWDRRDLAPPSAIAIHHPGVEEKRISFENDPTSITAYLEAAPNATATHIRVTDWDLGTTEGGSSGSPLYSPDQRIVGQLHGGFASCTSQTADWYGRVYHSMNTGMAAILDPTGTGAQTVGGREANSSVFAQMTATPTQLGRNQTARVTVTITNADDAATNGVQFTNTMPANLTLAGNVVASAGTASTAGGALTWTVDLAVGASATISYDVTVSNTAPVGQIVNQGTVSHSSLTAPQTLSVTFQIVVPPDYLYSNTTPVTIPDNACPTDVTSTIVVPAGFDPIALKVGVNLTHTYRGDLNLRIANPQGTVVGLLDDVGGSAENLDALFSDSGAAGAFSSGDHSVAAPFYDVEGRAGAPLAPLADQLPSGTWTLRVCDDAGQDLGSVNQWALYFYTAGGTAGEPDVVATAEVTVEGARPNPTTGQATVRFAARDAQHVRAVVVDAAGRTVATLLDRPVSAGIFETLDVDAARLPAGTYFVRIVGETFSQTRSVSVVR